MNYTHISFCVGAAALVIVGTYIIWDLFNRSKKKKYHLPKNDTVKSEIKKPEYEAVRSEKKPENEAVMSEIKKPQNEAVRSEITKPQNAAARSEITKPQNAATRSEITKPQNAAARSEITKPRNAAMRSEITKPQTEVARSDIKKPENRAVRSEIKNPRNAAMRSKIKKSEKQRPIKKQRPNYFVAIQISDDQIINSLSELQQHMLDRDQYLMEGMKQLTTLHITLMVMFIEDAETHARALDTLRNIHREHDDDLSKNPLKLEFKGLDHFNNRVLYAKLSEDHSYRRLISLAKSVRSHYATASIFTTDSRFTPHLTVMDVKDAWKNKMLPKEIDPSLYKDFNDRYFGVQEVQNIQLLSMDDSRDEFGYYLGNTIYFSAFEPKAQRNYHNKMLETGETKKVQRDYRKRILETEETKKSIILQISSLMK